MLVICEDNKLYYKLVYLHIIKFSFEIVAKPPKKNFFLQKLYKSRVISQSTIIKDNNSQPQLSKHNLSPKACDCFFFFHIQCLNLHFPVSTGNSNIKQCNIKSLLTQFSNDHSSKS